VPWPRDLPPEWVDVYVDTDVPEGVAALAREITEGVGGYYDTAAALEQHLLGEYYYSLVPGDALDGDQLTHFLFESRKGYCSYFAFSMALMARSLGIPSRVAAGFFIVPETGMLGFHPVRGDMAHAWVEVYFPGIGWVEFDPTSQNLAPGELISTDYQIDRERLAGLVQEILDAPGDETVDVEPAPTMGALRSRLTTMTRVLRDRWYLLAVAIVFVVIVARRLSWRRLRRKDPAKAAILLFHHVYRIVSAGSTGSDGIVSDEDHHRFNTGTAPLAAMPYPLTEAGRIASRARLGPDFSRDDLLQLDRACALALTRHRRELRDRRGRRAPLIAGVRGVILPSRRGSMVVGEGRRTKRRKNLFRGSTVPVFLGLLAFFASGPTTDTLAAQQTDAVETDVDRLETEILLAIDAENYEEALRRIARARTAHPEESRFPLLEGDLYYDQELFKPAENAYREALALGASEYHTRYVLARALARLNRDAEAIEQLEALYLTWPDDSIVAGDLAWLYFKRHRLFDARDLLEQFLREHSGTRDIHMTLATVYAGLYDYDAALEVYNRAIEEARVDEDRFFQAVAYYNLSILHANFHRWQEALDAAERSLTATERSSGYMIRAELAYRRMDFEGSVADYLRADTLDRETPLPGLSLAAVWSATGHPDRAIQRMDRILKRENANWMYSYRACALFRPPGNSRR